jgi:hypothetical protein
VYGVLGVGNTVVTLARAFLFAYGGVCAARTLHDTLLSRLLGGTVGFFDSTPVCGVAIAVCLNFLSRRLTRIAMYFQQMGRLLNRVSTDVVCVVTTMKRVAVLLLLGQNQYSCSSASVRH